MLRIIPFIIKYRTYLIGAATILIIIIASTLWLNSHDEKIRLEERGICKAARDSEELARKQAVEKANEQARKTKDKNIQKAKLLTPVGVVSELDKSGWLRND